DRLRVFVRGAAGSRSGVPGRALLPAVGRASLLRDRPGSQPDRVGGAGMRAVKLMGPERIEVHDAPAPELRADTDAIVRVTHTAICGADLLPYHGYTPGFELGTTLGHEFVGVVEDAGDGLGGLSAGQRVVNTSMTSDGTC